ncbi:gp53-like domain-containing protein, partial [Yersinia enterocolitica]
NLDLAALLGDALQKANNLSEIKTAGPAAVAQTLLNLGLGDAAKRSVGTGVGQIPDMSSFISSFTQNGYFKFPGKLIIQWGEV